MRSKAERRQLHLSDRPVRNTSNAAVINSKRAGNAEYIDLQWSADKAQAYKVIRVGSQKFYQKLLNNKEE